MKKCIVRLSADDRLNLLIVFSFTSLMLLLNSCGGGSGGDIVGDLNTDMDITRDTVIPSELRAKNLIIENGVHVTSPGDLRIQTAGLVTLNGHIGPGAKLTLISAGGLTLGANGIVDGGDGDMIIVSDPSLVPTDAQIDALSAQGTVVDGTSARASRSGRDGSVYQIPVKTFPPGAKGRAIFIDVTGTGQLGKAGGPAFVQNVPPGIDGTNVTDCPATGNPGHDGRPYAITAGALDIEGSVTVNLAAGGKGGDATTTATCCPGTARGGRGGNTGTGYFVAASGITVNGGLTVNFGNGGAGGKGTAIAPPKTSASCPPPVSCDATGIGGAGGKGALAANARGNISGPGTITCGGGTGGKGGDGIATGGDAGSSTCCPAGQGPKGGAATATGGTGGDSIAQISGGISNGGGFVGGDGGNQTPNGGKGGTGATCCNPPQPGGKGGIGGPATANGGTHGTGSNSNGADGTAAGKAGDGGLGGTGSTAGPAGDGGTGSGVPNGGPGAPGGVCGGGGNCVNEIEPNDTEQTATVLITAPQNPGNSVNGCGTLADINDKDHFYATENAGAFQVQVTQVPPSGNPYLYLHVGNNQPQTFLLSQTTSVIFTVAGTNVPVYIGFFNGMGDYKFTLTDQASRAAPAAGKKR